MQAAELYTTGYTLPVFQHARFDNQPAVLRDHTATTTVFRRSEFDEQLAVPRDHTATTTATIFQFDHRSAATEIVKNDDREVGPSEEDKLDATLMSYRKLPEGWDGYEGVPAAIEAVTDALVFLILLDGDLPLPYPQIGSGGEVGLYWRTEKVFAEIEFLGDGQFSYYARLAITNGELEEHLRDGYDLAAGRLPENLISVINKIER